MGFRVRGNWVAAVPVRDWDEKVGDIYLPETTQLPMLVAKVYGVGPGPQLEDGRYLPIDVSPGDRIVYRGFFPNIQRIDGIEYDFILSDFIDCIVKENEEIVPINDRILTTVPKQAVGKEGDLALPETFKQSYYTATVVAVGPGRYNELGDRVPLELMPGEQIFFHRYGGCPIATSQGAFFVTRPSNLLFSIPEDG